MSINPNLNIKTYDKKITKNNIRTIFKNTEVIIEAFDKPEYKKLIIETYINSNKLIVAASGIAGFGKSDEMKTHKIKDNLYIIGDLKTEANQINPPLSPRVNIAAAKQADVVLEYFLK
jgi:sulfur carrier protein ThiS adenylyltransferase